MNFLKKLWNDQTGQGMTEYILIVAIIAIAAIAVIKLFGKEIRGLFTHATDELKDATKPVK